MSPRPNLRRLLNAGRRLVQQDTPRASTADELRRELERFGKWVYPFELADGVVTPLQFDWLAEAHETRFRMMLPEIDALFDGRWDEVSCLDAGCNEGYVGFEIARRGAKAVVGFDARPQNIEKAEFVKRQLQVKNISFDVANIDSLTPERYGAFDLTLFLGLLYHLEDPIGALRRLRAVTRELCVVDTQVLRDGPSVTTIAGMEEVETNDILAVLEEPEWDESPLAAMTVSALVPNKSALFTMLRHAGFRNVRQAMPYPGCYDRYANFDRVIVFASV